MKEKLISERFTFTEIKEIVSERNDGFTKLFDGLFNLALLFCPSLKLPSVIASSVLEQDITVGLMDAKERLGNCVSSISRLVEEKNADTYYKKYNNMIIAHFLLVFSAFYDSVRMLLPDKEYKVSLDDEITFGITEDAVKKYAEKYRRDEGRTVDFDSLSFFPYDPFAFSFSDDKLTKLYRLLTDEFSAFYRIILDDESISSATADRAFAKIRALPEIAVETYSAQYAALKEKSVLFSAYAITGEHRLLADKIDAVLLQLQKNTDNDTDKRILSVLDVEKRYYGSLIRKRTLYGGGDDEYSMLPLVEDIFIPQSYKSLIYQNDGKKRTLLGPDNSWNAVQEKDDLQRYVIQAVESHGCGRKPIIILGEPGGGKSTLCNYLAAKVFPLQYHTIIVRLREVNADESIPTQIEQQIKRDIGDDLKWGDIKNCVKNSEMPLLLIFDGYDELLRVGGKRYTNFIKEVYRFQKTQEEIHQFFTRAIITSRRNLIDLAEIPNMSAIICLQEFSKDKIDEWVGKWNRHNSAYYQENGVQPFAIRSQYAELAKQPLLLAMLAMYDYDGNALASEREINTSGLYHNLLENYVKRELNKNVAAGAAIDKNETGKMYQMLYVAAMGMLNRGRLFLTKEQFEQDLSYYGISRPDSGSNSLGQGINLFGSFFFVNTSKATQLIGDQQADYYTYEFLHTTFGEYLAADYICKVYAAVLSECQKNGSVTNQPLSSLLSAIGFMCFSERPNILKLLGEMNDKRPLDRASDFVTGALRAVLSGDILIRIDQWLNEVEIPYEQATLIRYSALFGMNLISVSACVDKECFIGLSDTEWGALIQILRAGLKEEELEVFSFLHYIEPKETGYRVLMQFPGKGMTDNLPHVERVHMINHVLCDEISLAFSGTVYADCLVEPYISKHALELKSELYYLMLVKNMFPSKEEMSSLLKAQESCFTEENFDILIELYRFVQKRYKNRTTYQRDLAVFFDDGVNHFNMAPGKYFYDEQYRTAFAELLNISSLIRITYKRYWNVQETVGYSPVEDAEEAKAIIDFMISGLSSVPVHQRDQEIEKILIFVLKAYSNNRLYGICTAEYLIKSVCKTLNEESIFCDQTKPGGLYHLASEIIGGVLNSCRSLNRLSFETLQGLRYYFCQTYYRDINEFYSLIQFAYHNRSFISLCEYWLSHISEYSEAEIHMIINLLSYLKDMGAAIKKEKLSQAEKQYDISHQFIEYNNEYIKRLAEDNQADDAP